MQKVPPGVALVTGSPRRIGREIAMALARRGWSLALHCRALDDDTRQLQAEIEALGVAACAVVCDLAEVDAGQMLLSQAEKHVGPVTCLVNNASVFLEDDIASLAPGTWDLNMAVNLRAPIFLAQAFAKQLPAHAHGNIINIIDQRVWRTTPEFFSYTVAKSALWTATKMLAQALAPRIRVNGIGPGPVLKSLYQTDEDFAAEARSTLLGHGASPEAIAEAVLFLTEATSMTGQMLALDGGQHLAWHPLGGQIS